MCTKPLSEAALELFGSWQDQGGVSIQRSRSWGIVTYADKWQWPSDPEHCCFLALAVIAAVAIAARTGCMAMGALKHPEKLNVMRGCHGMCAD